MATLLQLRQNIILPKIPVRIILGRRRRHIRRSVTWLCFYAQVVVITIMVCMNVIILSTASNSSIIDEHYINDTTTIVTEPTFANNSNSNNNNTTTNTTDDHILTNHTQEDDINEFMTYIMNNETMISSLSSSSSSNENNMNDTLIVGMLHHDEQHDIHHHDSADRLTFRTDATTNIKNNNNNNDIHAMDDITNHNDTVSYVYLDEQQNIVMSIPDDHTAKNYNEPNYSTTTNSSTTTSNNTNDDDYVYDDTMDISYRPLSTLISTMDHHHHQSPLTIQPKDIHTDNNGTATTTDDNNNNKKNNTDELPSHRIIETSMQYNDITEDNSTIIQYNHTSPNNTIDHTMIEQQVDDTDTVIEKDNRTIVSSHNNHNMTNEITTSMIENLTMEHSNNNDINIYDNNSNSSNDDDKEMNIRNITSKVESRNTAINDTSTNHTNDTTDCNHNNNSNIDTQQQQQHLYVCGIWGTILQRRYRPIPNMYILQQLFTGEIIYNETFGIHPNFNTTTTILQHNFQNVTTKLTMKYPYNETTTANIINSTKRRSVANSALESDGSNIDLQASKSSTSSILNDFVTSGLHDIQELFDHIDPPDELDVGTNGVSIQEVLMGSATRVVSNRISIIFQFTFHKMNTMKNIIIHHTRNMIHNTKIFETLPRDYFNFTPFLEWVRNMRKNEFFIFHNDDDDQFKPLHWLHQHFQDNKLVQQLRDRNFDWMTIWKDNIVLYTIWLKTQLIYGYHTMESLFDQIFTGTDDDDEEDYMDLNFLPNMRKELNPDYQYFNTD